MSNIKDGGPAFARTAFSNSGGMVHEQDGMSLRDYFAGQVLAGGFPHKLYVGGERLNYLAESAYRMADAMLKAREVTP